MVLAEVQGLLRKGNTTLQVLDVFDVFWQELGREALDDPRVHQGVLRTDSVLWIPDQEFVDKGAEAVVGDDRSERFRERSDGLSVVLDHARQDFAVYRKVVVAP